MTFPVVQASNGGASSATAASVPLNMPAGVQVGDLLMGIYSAMRTAANPTWSTGWTVLQAPTGNIDLGIAYRVADGGANDAATVANPGSATGYAYQTLRISGQHGATAPVNNISGATGLTFDPLALNPATWDVEDTLWLASAGFVHGASGGVPSFIDDPDGFTLVREDGTAVQSSDSGRQRTVSLQSRAASVDPTTFGISGASTKGHTVVLIAVRPLVPDPPLQELAGGVAGLSALAADLTVVAGAAALPRPHLLGGHRRRGISVLY